jgi:hypothetical protein
MALDFPASPTNGQAYEQYVYDSALPGWRSKGGAVAATYVSDTAPSGAVKGDMWYRSSDGTTYVFVVDDNSSQWVEIRSEISTAQVGFVPIVPTSISVNAGSASVASSGEISFTGNTVLNLNGTLSSVYRNYRIVMECENGNATDIYLRPKNSSGTLTSGYNNHNMSVFTNGGVGGSYVANQAYFIIARSSGSAGSISTTDVSNLGNTEIKRHISFNEDAQFLRMSGGINTSTTAYTDIVISSDVAFSGATVKIYGYN